MNRKEMFNSWLRITGRFLIVVLLGLGIYLVYLSPWSSASLAEYNKGYGAFDLHFYTVDSVAYVLFFMQPEGFALYDRYLIGDTILIVALLMFQVMMSRLAYDGRTRDSIFKILILFSFLRFVCDLLENGCLYYVVHQFPTVNELLINIASIATLGKVICLAPWLVMILAAMARGFKLRKYKKRGRRK